MAQDIGTTDMADVDAVLPDNPTIGREQQDYNVPRPLFTSEFNLPKTEQIKNAIIQVRSTIFQDAFTGLSQFFSNLATVEENNAGASVLALNIFAYISGLVGDETKVGRTSWEFLNDISRFLIAGCVQLRLKAINDDTFSCVTLEGTEEGTTSIVVSQPPRFRKTSFSGQTNQGISYVYTDASNPHIRRATTTIDGSSATIVEEIIPRYEIDETIYAIRVLGNPGLPPLGSIVPNLLVINDGRYWAKTGAPD